VIGTWQHAASTNRPGRALRVTARGLASPAAYAPTRFNPGNLLSPGFETLYLALGRDTALFEKRALFGDPYDPRGRFIPGPKMSNAAVIDVDVDLRTVVDLTNLGIHALLQTTAQELTGDWKGYELRGQTGPGFVLTAPTGVAPIQMLGWELFNEPHIEGIKVISAMKAVTCCLVVFTHKLQRPGSLSWHDPNTNRRESYP
jgi:RES domain